MPQGRAGPQASAVITPFFSSHCQSAADAEASESCIAEAAVG